MIAVVATLLILTCPFLVIAAFVHGVRYENRRQEATHGRAGVTIRHDCADYDHELAVEQALRLGDET